MEYNYAELFPKLADGKGGKDGDLHRNYTLSGIREWDEKAAEINEPEEDYISQAKWHSYTSNIDWVENRV